MDIFDSVQVIFNIMRDLTNSPNGVSTSEIVERYGINRRTVPKYMDILDSVGIPIYQERKRWFVSDTFQTPFSLSVDESEILALALETFRDQHPSYWRTTNTLFRKLTDRMPDDIGSFLQGWLSSELVTSRIEDNFLILTKARRSHSEVVIDYLPLSKPEISRWRIRPFQFVRNPHSDGIYLLCDGTKDGTTFIPLTLKLNRICAVEETVARFMPVSREVLMARVHNAWGIWAGRGESQKVILRFNPHQAQRLRESLWHGSTQIVQQADDYLLYTVFIGDWREIVPWVRAWGEDVEVLEPPALRNKIMHGLRHQMRLYGLMPTIGLDDTSQTIHLLWAKYQRTTGVYHKLLYHLIDVAAVAYQMWEFVLSDSQRQWLCDITRLDSEGTQNFLAILVGLHDIGKATPDFQRKAVPLYQVLLESGLPDARDTGKAHGVYSVAPIQEWLVRDFGLSKVDARPIALAIGGHHGQWISNRETSSLPVPASAWHHLQEQLYQQLRGCFRTAQQPVLGEEVVNILAVFISGFTSVCDWIGSMEAYFPYVSDSIPVNEYRDSALTQATYALSELGWFGWRSPRSFATFSDMFGFSPNPLQQAIIETLQQLDAFPELVIVEYLTGGGKTEASLYLADQYINQAGLAGIYVAMPTQATGNQMFTRVANYLTRRYPDDSINIQLIHSQAHFHPLFRAIQAPRNREGNESGLVAESWFQGKRTLLSPMAVGTVDQAMLSVLQVRHHFVRQFALSHKVMIFDEAHAYDTYMSVIIDRLLGWLRVLQSPTILLSATLPRSTRENMLRNFGIQPADIPEVSYPRMTIVKGGQLQVVPLPRPTSREIQMELIPDGVNPLIDVLANLYQLGGCLAVVCNTVNEAIEVAQALRNHEAIDNPADIYLFHARFPPLWRDEIEQDVVSLFGKDGERPVRAILVATQIIEQSLDLDFDLMVTSTAPIDLVIQRVGRLFRHERIRPNHLSVPTLIVREPSQINDNGVPSFAKDEFVYDRYILLRSWFVLREISALRLPDELDLLVESVYGDQSVAPIPEPYRAAVDAAYPEFEKSRRSDAYKGSLGRIGDPTNERLIGGTSMDLPDDGDDTAVQVATRDIEPGIDVICLHEVQGQVSLQDNVLAPCDLDHRPSGDELEALGKLRLTIRNRSALATLRNIPVPRGWANVARLRNVRPLIFKEGLWVPEEGGVEFRLSREYGLEIVRSIED